MLSHLKQPLSASSAYCIWDTVLFVCVASIVNSFVYQIFFFFFQNERAGRKPNLQKQGRGEIMVDVLRE